MSVSIPIAALGALKTGRPVKVTLDRDESVRSSTKRHAFAMDYKVGLDRQGYIHAVDADILMDAGPYTGQSEWVMEQACIFACGPYRVSALRVRGRGAYTNNGNGGAFRGFGINQVAFAMESLLDEAARRLEIDPIELRMRNVLRQDDVTPAGERLTSSVGAMETLEAAKRTFSTVRCQAASRPGWKRGVGIATAYKNVGWGRGTVDNGSAFMQLEADGRVTLIASAPDMGQGIRTGLVQIVHQVLGSKRDMVDLRLLDTASVFPSHGGAGERLTFCAGNAVLMAATRLKREVLAAVERTHGFPPPDLVRMKDGVLEYRPGGRTVRVALAEIAAQIERENGTCLSCQELYEAPKTYNLDARGSVSGAEYKLYAAYSYTTAIAAVEVDEDGKSIEVQDLYIFQDVGKAINPQIIEGQLEGSCMQALGYALKEEYRLKEGVPQGMTFRQLGVPTVMDAPRYHSFLIETIDPHGPFGAKGISEVAMIPTTAAIVNAIRDATGIRVYDLPVKKNRIRD
jgi:CO/xanthine dehydrogenase Mo-binding subunit